MDDDDCLPPKLLNRKKCNIAKRPPNAFILFCRDTRPALVQKCPKMASSDISSLLSHLWRSLEPVSKQNYKQRAAKLLTISERQGPPSPKPPLSTKFTKGEHFQTVQTTENIIETIPIPTGYSNNPPPILHQQTNYYPMLNPNELYYQNAPQAKFDDVQGLLDSVNLKNSAKYPNSKKHK